MECDKLLQETTLFDIEHPRIQVWFDGRWIELEGVTLDQDYFPKLQERFADLEGAFCAFGAATADLKSLGVQRRAANTYAVQNQQD